MSDRLLDIAQSLYEKHKLTTYPRTDCGYLPVSQHAEAGAVFKALVLTDRNLIGLVAKADANIKGRVWNDSKITAHHGIIPTAAAGTLDGLSEHELFVYDLIRKRYLAQFFPEHEYDQTVIELDCNGYVFRTTGRVDRIDGWKTAYQDISDVDDETADKNDAASKQRLPRLSVGDAVLVQQLDMLKQQTKPPAPYTEGTLVQAMKSIAKLVENPKLKAILRDNAGIGTEATRAAIIETLLQRGLVVREGKKKLLRATPKGMLLISMLPDAVKDPAMTAVWEQALESIASGDMTLVQFMEKQQGWLAKVVEQAKATVPAVTANANAGAMDQATTGRLSSQKTGAVVLNAGDSKSCPACGKAMQLRNGKYGQFWGCSDYPNCKTIIKLTEVNHAVSH